MVTISALNHKTERMLRQSDHLSKLSVGFAIIGVGAALVSVAAATLAALL